MLNDEKNHTAPSEEADTVTITAHMPDPARAGVVDVVSLRGLARAVSVLRKGDRPTAFDDAFVRILNTNGSIAKAIEGD
ncbi:hypothetical protein ACFZ8E_19145 [Methylobacterium sp. HMF5984]|uniref:hypothetical protein n=1 Tax=Methylobacterium sp. HMF5984 TaxID=3367370 RepID=UPI0038554BA2